MMHKAIQLDWQIVDNDSEEQLKWEGDQFSNGSGDQQKRLKNTVIHTVAFALILLFIAGHHLWTRSTSNLAIMQTDIQRVIDAEFGANHARAAGLDAHIQDFNLVYNQAGVTAIVELKISNRESQTETTETRLFRADKTGWRQVGADGVPIAPQWGERQYVETPHIRLTFYAKDKEAALLAAPVLEGLYVKMRQRMLLPMATSSNILQIEMARNRLPASWQPGGKIILTSPSWLNSTTPSPAVAAVEPTIVAPQDAVDYLGNIAQTPIAKEVLHEWLAERPIDPNWNIVMHAAEWWLRGEPSSKLDSFQKRHSDKLPHLYDLSTQGEDWFYANDQTERISLAIELLNYVQTTYGRAILIEFLDALTLHNSWHTLIPAVFHIPAAEFEAEWQDQVAN